MNETKSMNGNSHLRIRVGIIFTIVGLFIYILGANPAIFGLDRSPVTGFIQIAVFLVGLATICIGGFVTLNALWNGEEKSIMTIRETEINLNKNNLT